jgi:hypothetical protein
MSFIHLFSCLFACLDNIVVAAAVVDIVADFNEALGSTAHSYQPAPVSQPPSSSTSLSLSSSTNNSASSSATPTPSSSLPQPPLSPSRIPIRRSTTPPTTSTTTASANGIHSNNTTKPHSSLSSNGADHRHTARPSSSSPSPTSSRTSSGSSHTSHATSVAIPPLSSSLNGYGEHKRTQAQVASTMNNNNDMYYDNDDEDSTNDAAVNTINEDGDVGETMSSAVTTNTATAAAAVSHGTSRSRTLLSECRAVVRWLHSFRMSYLLLPLALSPALSIMSCAYMMG